ncbi:c-type cytochrome, methanol metabolism-related [Methylosinus sp. Sm6]|uniref:c-type cytochrome, methanol metabolism-related n=1 Tax=Methylosinus sp. Sm6 TaxID=2866948 RepID=UPI002107833F|nr:c-type cytochrome, methanol metabolism-related [Methylosinus sp. Sm6]
MRLPLVGAVALSVFVVGTTARAEPPGDPTAVKEVDGKYFDKNGDPTYKVQADGTVDWYTFSGYRRYHAECHVCHGPNAEGSTYAPALKNSVKTFNYAEFYGIVVSGRENKVAGNDSVMPAFADNKNAMCYIDDLYIYLRARSTEAVGRGRPEKKEAKPAAFAEAEAKCMSGK